MMVDVTRRRITVVLADDHAVVRNGLAAMINQQTDMAVVAEAGDGEAAIALYNRCRPDVMVLDLRMPKCDGVGVIQRVRARHPDARILILTTCDAEEDILTCMSQGAKGYLLKDAPRQEILAAIRTLAANAACHSAVAGSALRGHR
jgi:DNA-binding NarL/FixJ family response regulator